MVGPVASKLPKDVMVSREEIGQDGYLNPAIPLPQTAQTTKPAANIIRICSIARKFFALFCRGFVSGIGLLFNSES